MNKPNTLQQLRDNIQQETKYNIRNIEKCKEKFYKKDLTL